MNMQKLMETRDSLGLLVLRVVTGSIFIAHGLPKMGWMGDGGGPSELGVRWAESDLIPFPMLGAYLIAYTEVFGGALLILGYLTRVVTAMQAFAMLVAVFAVHWSNGFAGRGGYQWALLLAAAAFCLMLEGGGKYSLDRKLSSK
jgi:putative oxidoreductase